MFGVYIASIIGVIVVGVTQDYVRKHAASVTGIFFGFGMACIACIAASWLCITVAGPLLALQKKRRGIAILAVIFTPLGFFFALCAEDRSTKVEEHKNNQV